MDNTKCYRIEVASSLNGLFSITPPTSIVDSFAKKFKKIKYDCAIFISHKQIFDNIITERRKLLDTGKCPKEWEEFGNAFGDSLLILAPNVSELTLPRNAKIVLEQDLKELGNPVYELVYGKDTKYKTTYGKITHDSPADSITLILSKFGTPGTIKYKEVGTINPMPYNMEKELEKILKNHKELPVVSTYPSYHLVPEYYDPTDYRYDVRVRYEGLIPKLKFGNKDSDAIVSRFLPLKEGLLDLKSNQYVSRPVSINGTFYSAETLLWKWKYSIIKEFQEIRRIDKFKPVTFDNISIWNIFTNKQLCKDAGSPGYIYK